MSLLGIRLRTSRSDGSRFSETGDLGTPRALSSDRRLLRGGRLGASSPGLGCSPLGTERTRNRASLSLYLGLFATLGSGDSGFLCVAFRPDR